MSRRLVRNTLALSSVQVARIGFNTFLSLMIAHLLGVEGLGKYAVLTAYLQIFQVLITLGAPRLVVREIARRSHCEDGKRRWFQVMLVNQALGAGIGAPGLVVLAHALNHPPLTVRALEVASFSLLPFAVSSAAEAVLQAEERMELIALAQFVSQGVQVVGSVVVLLAGDGIVALAGMIVAKQVASALIELWAVRSAGVWRDFHVDVVEAVRLSRASSDLFAQSVMVIVFSRIGTLILVQMVNEEAAGLYNVAHLVIQVVNFLSASYSRAVYPVLARLFGEGIGRFRSLLRRSILFGLLATLIIAIQTVTVAAPIVNLLYGEDYSLSIKVLQVEAPFVIVFFWNALLSSGLLASDLQRRSVVVSGVKLGASLIFYPLLTAWLGAVGTALGTVLSGFAGAVLNYYFLSREVCSLNLSDLVVKPLLIGALVFGGMQLGRGIPWPGLVVGGLLIYFLMLMAFQVISREEIRLIRRILFS